MQAGLLREAIRIFLREEQMPKFSLASVYRDIERTTGGLFKYNGNRLTLVDKASRPFEGMESEQVETQLVSFIEDAGYDVKEVVAPGKPFDGVVMSSKFNTFVVSPKSVADESPESTRRYGIVFGFSFSSAETDQFEGIDQAVSSLVAANDGEPILIWNGLDHVPVDNVDRVGHAGGKADVILRHGSEPVIKVSLKNLRTGRASDMQQWSGLIKFMDHPEVADFVEAVKNEIDSGFGGRMWRPIEDENLKMQAMWEDDSGPVDVILAGTTPKLARDGGTRYRLDVDLGSRGMGGVWYHKAEENPDGPFEPVMMVRPATKDRGRKLGDIPGMRGMIMPLGAVTGPTKEI